MLQQRINVNILHSNHSFILWITFTFRALLYQKLLDKGNESSNKWEQKGYSRILWIIYQSAPEGLLDVQRKKMANFILIIYVQLT